MKNIRNSTVYQLMIISLLTGICFADSRPLNQEEKDRLSAARDKNTHRLTSSIDITYSQKTIRSASYTEARRKSNQQKTEKRRKTLNKPKLEVKSFGIMTPEGEEIVLSHSRIQIKDIMKYREDVAIFADEKKEKKRYDRVHISNNEISFNIDKKRKTATCSDKYKWGQGRDTLTYGTLLAHKETAMEITRLQLKGKGNRGYRHKGIVKITGQDVVVIEVFDSKNENSICEMFLDVNDWTKPYKFVLYNEGGTGVETISEFSNYSKDREDRVYYPHLIIKTHFDAEGKEESRDVINIEEVSVGLSIPDDVFELNVGSDYQIIDKQ